MTRPTPAPPPHRAWGAASTAAIAAAVGAGEAEVAVVAEEGVPGAGRAEGERGHRMVVRAAAR